VNSYSCIHRVIFIFIYFYQRPIHYDNRDLFSNYKQYKGVIFSACWRFPNPLISQILTKLQPTATSITSRIFCVSDSLRDNQILATWNSYPVMFPRNTNQRTESSALSKKTMRLQTAKRIIRIYPKVRSLIYCLQFIYSNFILQETSEMA